MGRIWRQRPKIMSRGAWAGGAWAAGAHGRGRMAGGGAGRGAEAGGRVGRGAWAGGAWNGRATAPELLRRRGTTARSDKNIFYFLPERAVVLPQVTSLPAG